METGYTRYFLAFPVALLDKVTEQIDNFTHSSDCSIYMERQHESGS